MVSSASSQIEATAGAKIINAKGLPDYGKVSTILIGVVAGAIILLCLVGAEAHSSHFEHGKVAFEAGAANDESGFLCRFIFRSKQTLIHSLCSP